MLAELAADFVRGEKGGLKQLYVSLSNICNARCVYCDVHEAVAQRSLLTPAEFAATLAEARRLGCVMVHFMGGGEPLIAREFLPAAAACADLGLEIAVTTNGSHLKARLAALSPATSLRLVLLSIDSHRPEVHDQVRVIPGLWARAMEGVAECRRLFPRARIVFNHVLTTRNIDELEAFVTWAGEAGAEAVNLIPVKDTPGLEASAGQAERFVGGLDGLRAQARAVRVELLFGDGDVAGWAVERAGATTSKEYRCVFPEHALYLDLPTGAVFPCDCTVHRKPEERFRLGDLRSQSLEEIWRGEPVAALREILASPCDPGCKAQCDWNNRRTNRALLAGTAA